MEKEFYFKSASGVSLCGTIKSPDKKTKKCVILCHGITVSKDTEDVFPRAASVLADEGIASLRFDFNGHGKSGGASTDFSISGQIEDITAAVLWARKNGYQKLGMAAASFGAGAAVEFCAKIPQEIKALALLFPAIDYNSLLLQKTPWAKKYFCPENLDQLKTAGAAKIGSSGYAIGSKLVREMKEFFPFKKLDKIDIPIMFVHGDSDTCVPLADSIKYSKTSPKSFLKIIKGGEHGLHNTEEIFEKTAGLLAKFFFQKLKMKIHISDNRYFNALLVLMLGSAAIHMVLLFGLAAARQDWHILNYINILDLDLFIPELLNGPAGDMFSWAIAGGLYIAILLASKKN